VQEVTMTKLTLAQPGLFDPSPPPIRLPSSRHASVVALLGILLSEAVAPPRTVREPRGAAEAGDEQDHA